VSPKLAFVVPRYGARVIGGAEYAARMLAEGVAARAGWEVEVLTTCAVDAGTWADEEPAGETVEGGVRVVRIPSRAGRAPDFPALAGRVLANPRAATMDEALGFIAAQGPDNPSLVEAAAASDADVVAFYPYLYHPTVHGVPAVGERAILHAAAHDEGPFWLPVFPPVFEAVSGFVFHTDEERRLVERAFDVASTPSLVLGLGVDDPPAVSGPPPVEGPYVLYLGRQNSGKALEPLIRFFAEHKAARPGPLRLVMAGPPVDPLPDHPEVVKVGPVDDDTRWSLLRGAEAFVHPSAHESFGLVLLESWLADTPVLVNRRSGAMRELVERSGGGLLFDGYASFSTAVDRLAGDADLRTTLASAGRAFTEATYRWPALVDRYVAFLDGVLARR
jgi:glycosyltransferase involved in cell wall biosynthesis